jgi:3-hydroxyisobutyrate dehydrogenase-like beta-hydroxyacid dehydrogenase
MTQILFYGFGEAGQAFASGWNEALSGKLSAYDLNTKIALPLGVQMHKLPAAALQNAHLIFCLVTADQALAAAKTAAPFLKPGTYWLDGNSCSPGAKSKASGVIEAAGGKYVDLAIMAPVHPKLHATPCLLGGPHAEEINDTLQKLGMDVRVMGEKVGDASTIKMLRSVMIKGLEALTAECLLAARRAGVEDKVIASLQASDPGFNWQQNSTYNLERMMVHGKRRAAEMREVAITLEELGMPNRMALAITQWQDDISALGLPGGEADFASRADRILDKLK